MATDAIARQRIDKWLFFARVVKSRSLGAKLATSGRVRINGTKCEYASATVKPGDTLTLTLEQRIMVYRVEAPGTRRGPAEEAHTLYADLSPQAGDGSELPDELPPFRGRPG